MKKNIAMLVAGATYLYVAKATGRVLGPMRIGAGANGQEEVAVTLPDGVMAVPSQGVGQVTGMRIQDVEGISAKDLKAVETAMAEHLEAIGKARSKTQSQKDAAAALAADEAAQPTLQAVATEDQKTS